MPRSEVPCFLLSGGLGIRLRSVEARPKALVPIAGMPFILFLVRSLYLQGFHRLHFLLGHGSHDVRRVLEGPDDPSNYDPRYDRRLGAWLSRVRAEMTWSCHVEEAPMGTGGALARVRQHGAETNLVLNADSFVEILYGDLLAQLRPRADAASTGAAVTPRAALAAVWMGDRSDYGGLDLGEGGRVSRFVEKGAADPGWINGGAYALRGDVLAELPEGPSSLERDLLPRLAEEGTLVSLAGRAYFRDIGTPKRLAEARRELPVWVRRMEDGGEL